MSIDHSVSEAMSKISDKRNVLVKICNYSHATRHSMRVADKPVDHPSKIVSEMLICSLNLVLARVSISRQKSPFTDGSDISTLEGLWKAKLFEMFDQFLENAAVVVLVSERFARIPTRRE